jgi:hypothetical protein
MIEKVYELDHDLDRFEGLDSELATDGHLEYEFEGCEKIHSAFFHCASIAVGGTEAMLKYSTLPGDRWRTVSAVLPGNITFTGLRKWLTPTDYPYIYQVNNWPIMSKKMVEAILSVGNVPHQTVPLIFKSEEEVERADVFGDIIPSLNRDYVLFQLLELSDVLDMDKSTYDLEPYAYCPTETFVCNVESPVFKEPEGGFPPIFRVKNDEIPLYVSVKAKEALEEAGIQGLRFSAMECS